MSKIATFKLILAIIMSLGTKMRETGNYQILGNIHFFTPYALPPKNPSLEITPKMLELYSQAMYNLGSLNEAYSRLPDQKQFIKDFIIKEALLSSAIEGIHATLADVLTHTQDESIKIDKNTQLVINYIKALDTAINLMREQNLPICSRVILAAHQTLLSCGDGDKAAPGAYRKQAVKVGNLIPPMAPNIPELMSDLDKYINEDSSLPPLIKIGLIHLQLETIHPFLDGNGRIGRLLIILMLMDSKLLKDPILYISYYLKKHQTQYYQALDAVRTQGDFESWINFYLQAVIEGTIDANTRIKEIEKLNADLKDRIANELQFSKNPRNAIAILNLLFSKPITTIGYLAENIDKTYNTTDAIVTKFIEMGIMSITPETQEKRYKQYRFDPYLALLEKQY